MTPRLLFLLLLLPWAGFSQGNLYQASQLPDSLVSGADAVILKERHQMKILSPDRAEGSFFKAVTVFNEQGEYDVERVAFYDDSRSLSNLQAEIYDGNGSLIEKIKSRDFIDQAAVDGFSVITDTRLKYFSYTAPRYPYTVVFSYEFNTSNTAFIPAWSPLSGYGVGLVNSSFELEIDGQIPFRIKEKNFEGFAIENNSSGRLLQYRLKNIPPFEAEEMSPVYRAFAPQLLVSLNEFHLEGVDGSATDWTSMGRWQYHNLIENRDQLPPETVAEVSQMLEGITDPREKVKRIYQYVQDNTRYISVQLGIGGWMPISAADVDKDKFGDCKGLTNYTKALLNSQGIPSNYCVVWAGAEKRDMEADFASMQGNHVILNVPLEQDEIWLECTSQTMPFNFLGDFTDDRKVLVLDPKGGYLKHTPAYNGAENLRLVKAKLALATDGSLKGEVGILSEGVEYDQRLSMRDFSEERRDTYYKNYWDYLNGIKISEVAWYNQKDSVRFGEKMEVAVLDYLSQAGNDLFFKPNTVDRHLSVPNRYRNRQLPFEVPRGYLHKAEFVIELPEGYVLPEIPEPVTIDSDFGKYQMEIIRISEREIGYQRSLELAPGQYAKNRYSDYRNFRREVARAENINLLLQPK
ncbi:DUF3857 domain-containing transglutaminase family protein [Robiginitalea myxolifaciens]|uniref:DUF3857 domain-containing transglutaminase family protein n=1 Tax=Robiginitalea myxolifaciens TaxID=400055 RepID=UPI0015A62729|nr:DUF3857 domain-containing protein [Robiginitalea myxolifaciens]